LNQLKEKEKELKLPIDHISIRMILTIYKDEGD
jgi:hypothetical protein